MTDQQDQGERAANAWPPKVRLPDAIDSRWVEEADEADAEPHICRGTD